MNQVYTPYEVVNTPHTHSWVETWWLAVSRPTVATYEELGRDPRASAGRAFGWMALATLFNLLLSLSLALVGRQPFASYYSGEMEESAMLFYNALTSSLAGLACCTPGYVVFSLVLFAVYGGITYLAARAMGGTGSYGGQLYLTAAANIPISLATGVVSWIPLIGWALALPVSMYGLVLNVIALKAAHTFRWRKAVAAYLALFGVLFAIGTVLTVVLVVLLVLLGPQIEGIFRDLNRELYDLRLLR